jgi:hypothetical protein
VVVALARFSRERNLKGVSDRSSARAAAAAKSVCEKGAKSVCEKGAKSVCEKGAKSVCEKGAKSVCEKGAKSVCETRDTTSLPLILMSEKVAIEKLPFKSAGARPSCV